MDELSEELQDLIGSVALANGFNKFALDVNKSVAKEGDGYIGIIEALTITDNDSGKKLSLVIKRAPTSKNLRKQFPTRLAFLREIEMYDKVFPDFHLFQKEHNIPNPFDAVTDMYGHLSEEFQEVLLLKNLKEEGFRLCDRTEPMNSHHLKLVVSTLAKFHAISFAMRKLEPERFRKIVTSVGSNVWLEFQASHISESNNSSDSSDPSSMLTSSDTFFDPAYQSVSEDPVLVGHLKKTQKVMQSLPLMGNKKDDQYLVLAHCDCWSANILFKYEDENDTTIPSRVKLIDWQLSYLSHPLHDLSYFFYINAGKKDLDNLQQYLEHYHDTLTENITAFGLDIDSVYPYALLEEHWKEYSVIGFFMCLVMMQQSLSEKKTHDMVQLAEQGEDILNVKSRQLEVSVKFRQRMRDLVTFLYDNQIPQE